ncbi:unnamed protein product [Gulo gulo]|uniref:Uncharacterized protein n=1 Tax=Gulo gulo TaxID=48420 RepID=A0A9X9LDZ5_GULGU|nr:unnamed protein product [Gulo gulo]
MLSSRWASSWPSTGSTGDSWPPTRARPFAGSRRAAWTTFARPLQRR